MSNQTPFERWWNEVGSGIAPMFYPEHKANTKEVAWEAWIAAKRHLRDELLAELDAEEPAINAAAREAA